ncbi:MAG: transcriptional regulator [Deltaproteobacteria bacterium RIFOXYD12_FULL_57_12]|nr:MAG: transcriptional regulator [Deltaproteobacteria bacterium RIFOXYD12_FULL_57_12]
MKHVIAFIKPHQLSRVAMGLRDIPGLTGMSIGKGQGFGRGRAQGAPRRIIEDEMAYIPHVRIEVFCSDERLEDVVACISTNAQTGLAGDGKIYVTAVVEAVRISNGERGASAV